MQIAMHISVAKGEHWGQVSPLS